MDRGTVLGKKIVVEINGREFLYTVNEIIELNNNYILFYDKFNKKQYCRWSDIRNILELENEEKN